MSGPPTVLLLHAADPLGEEGILADSAAIRDLGCRPATVTTGFLFPRRPGGSAVAALPLPLVAEQFEAAIAAASPAAARVGILADPLHVETVATLLHDCGARDVVVAPVVRSGGARIASEDTLDAIRRELFPLARVVIVRAADLFSLTGERSSDLPGLERGAREIRAQGARAALVTGGIRDERIFDVLDEGGRAAVLDASRVAAPRPAGAVGAHPAAVAAFLALGATLLRAADAAQRHMTLRLDRGSR